MAGFLVPLLGKAGLRTGIGMGLSLVDNVSNAFITSRTPDVPKPENVQFDRYNKNLNVTPELNAVTDTMRGTTKSLMQSGAGAGVVAANLAGLNASAINQRNSINARLANYQASIDNKNVDLTNRENFINTNLLNQYNKDVYQQQIGKQEAISGNISDAVSGIGQQFRNYFDEENSRSSQKDALSLLFKANPEVATAYLATEAGKNLFQNDSNIQQQLYRYAKDNDRFADLDSMFQLLGPEAFKALEELFK